MVILTVVPSILSKSKWYGWRKKSCTSWYGKYPIVDKVLYKPGGAGFHPTTVAPCKCFEGKYVSCCLPVLLAWRCFFLCFVLFAFWQMYSRNTLIAPASGLDEVCQRFRKVCESADGFGRIFFGGDGFAWMFQEVSKRLVNGLQPTY